MSKKVKILYGATPFTTLPNPLAVTSFFELLDRVIQLIFVTGLALSPVFLIWGAFQFLTSAGDAKKVTSGTDIIKYTIVGIVVIVFARAIVFIIRNVIGG